MAEPLFLLDTNILIYLLEGASPPARERVQSRRPGEVVTSAIAYAEVAQKVSEADAGKVNDVQALFSVIPVMPFDELAARAYARIPFKRETFDRLIAAQALALDLTLITNNERDFADVAELKVENWTKGS